MSLRYFGFITLQPVYPEEPQRANTEKRGNGGVQMGGGGAEIQGLLWKNSAEVRLSKSQGLPKATGEGGGSSALMKTSLRGLDTPPGVLPQQGWNVPESEGTVTALWEYEEQPRPSCVDWVKARWKGALMGQPSSACKRQFTSSARTFCAPLPCIRVPLAQPSRFALRRVSGLWGEMLLG